MADPRLVLHRPSAGLYDTLCQIGLCCLYAQRHARIVVVDANHPTAQHFRDDFSRYFVSRHPGLHLDLTRIGPLLDGLSVHPPEVAGRLRDYACLPTPGRPWLVERDSRVPLTFDFSRDHAAQVLVHHAGGRNPHALVALARLDLREDVRAETQRRLAAIGGPFHAMHIRATDYDTDYQAAFAKLPEPLTGRLFVATDNRDVLAYIRAHCPGAEVFNFSKLPETPGTPAHIITDPATAYRRNLDAIADLLVLSHARNLMYIPLKPNVFGANISGFLMLASQIRGHGTILPRLMAG